MPNTTVKQSTDASTRGQRQESARLDAGHNVSRLRFLQERSGLTNHLPSTGNIHKRRRINGESPPANSIADQRVLLCHSEYKADQVLRNQVFPYISRALGQYKGKIDSLALRMLGKKVCKDLCDNPCFYRDLEDNQGKLSNLYEGQIALDSRRLVAKYALAFMPNGPSATATTTTTSSQLTEPQADRTAIITPPPRAPVLIDSDDDSHRDSAAGRAWFRLSPVSDDDGPRAFARCSSSSATSPSISANRVITIESDVEITPYSEEKSHAVFVSISRRQPRRSAHHPGPIRVSKAGQKPPNRGPCKIISNPQVLTPLTSTKVTAYHHAIRLRLAAMGLDTPRPFLRRICREDIARGFNMLGRMNRSHGGFSDTYKTLLERMTLHVDFCHDELMYIAQMISADEDMHSILPNNCKGRILRRLFGKPEDIPDIKATLLSSFKSDNVGCKLIRSRGDAAIQAFLEDAADGLICDNANTTRLQFRYPTRQKTFKSPESINLILLGRSIGGNTRRAAGRNHNSLQNRFVMSLEDTLSYRSQWSDCSGDLATFAWTPDNGLVCGALAHLDEHNMQYNKPGNLLIGSALSQELNSLPEHRVPRPVVHKGENALQSMRRTQEPFLYCSVTSIAYSHDSKTVFTGGFDSTVKIWNVDTQKSPKMDLCGTWQHEGHVNFVVSSQHHSLIATASDVGQNAVRVYRLATDNLSCSPFDTYSGERADELASARRNSNVNWAYHPATMQWGKSATVSHLLLVGFSPRSYDCQDTDIPEDKVNTGELCLWDTRTGTRVVISTARTQNVFEVIWHPTQPIFVAATSPTGDFEDHVRTQLRLFGQTPGGSFSHLKTLDCRALDINEITLRPNSSIHFYVTASCTDGKTYVWDTAFGEQPVHVLSHGRAIDELESGIPFETGDVGVKFAAWGRSTDRFYTGSSDGVVKAWNLNMPHGKEHLRNVLTLSGGVSAGAWSPDFTKLVIGDSTGKVHLLSVDDETSAGEPLRRPITQHNPPPLDDKNGHLQSSPDRVEQTAREITQEYLAQGQIVLHPDPYVGAIQGPAYFTTNLFCSDAHKHSDPAKKALRSIRAEQKSRYHYDQLILPRLPQLIPSSSPHLHEWNTQLDLDFNSLPLVTQEEMLRDGLYFDFDDEFDLEEDDGVRQVVCSYVGVRYANENSFPTEQTSSSPLETEDNLRILTTLLNKELGFLRGFNEVLQAIYS